MSLPDLLAPESILTGFITPAELCSMLGVSPRTLYRWQAQRNGPPRCRVGKLIFYRIEAVRDWLTNSETPNAPSPTRRPRSGGR